MSRPGNLEPTAQPRPPGVGHLGMHRLSLRQHVEKAHPTQAAAQAGHARATGGRAGFLRRAQTAIAQDAAQGGTLVA